MNVSNTKYYAGLSTAWDNIVVDVTIVNLVEASNHNMQKYNGYLIKNKTTSTQTIYGNRYCVKLLLISSWGVEISLHVT